MTSDITLPTIDPNLLCIAVAAAMILGALLLLIYLPSAETLHKLEDEKKLLKLQRDYYINQWSVEMISHGKTKEEVASMITGYETELTKQKKKTRVFAKVADKLRGVGRA